MPQAKPLIIGTRGSKLALVQTQLVADALKRRAAEIGSELAIETKVITTKGDVDQSPIPLDTVGKAWFTSEIEEALLAGEIDLAIHSLKDMPPEIVPGLTTIVVLERADPRDVLISKAGAAGARGPHLKDLPKGATVGTDSARRKVLLLDQCPDLIVKSIRGNVDTRLKKLNGEGEFASGGGTTVEKYDAIVLAAAGLERLGMLGVVTEFFDPAIFSIAPGQGILAAQTRVDEKEIFALLDGISPAATRIAALAEQAFSHAIGGGCKLPIGCYARVEGEKIFIDGMVGGLEGVAIVRKSISGAAKDAASLAETLAQEFPR